MVKYWTGSQQVPLGHFFCAAQESLQRVQQVAGDLLKKQKVKSWAWMPWLRRKHCRLLNIDNLENIYLYIYIHIDDQLISIDIYWYSYLFHWYLYIFISWYLNIYSIDIEWSIFIERNSWGLLVPFLGGLRGVVFLYAVADGDWGAENDQILITSSGEWLELGTIINNQIIIILNIIFLNYIWDSFPMFPSLTIIDIKQD